MTAAASAGASSPPRPSVRLVYIGADPWASVSSAAAELSQPEMPLVVVIAGPHGPGLARAILTVSSAEGVPVECVPAQPLFDDCIVGQELLSLQHITRILREQCPWDRVQTAQDIVSYSLEEVYELADAIAEDDLGEQHGELGDVLFQVYFLSLLLEERGGGDLGSVAAAIERKLIRRHSHIFGDTVAATPAAVRGQWERIKRELEGREGVFHDVPQALPSLLFARKLQRRAAEVGFDWDSALEAFHKIAEEHAELAEAMAVYGPLPEFDHPAAAADAPAAADTSPPSPQMRHDPRLWHEFGDLLFATVNVARKAGIDPELALRQASQRFQRRIAEAERLARAEGQDWSELELDAQEEYYQRAKHCEGANPT